MFCVIAGEGSLPIRVIERLKSQNKEFRCVSFKECDYSNTALEELNSKDGYFYDIFRTLFTKNKKTQSRNLKTSLVDFDAVFSFFDKEQISEVVFCGRVRLPSFLSIVRNFNSLKKHFSFLDLNSVKKVLKGDDVLLKSILSLFESKGVKIISVQEVLPEVLIKKTDQNIYEESEEDVLKIKECGKIGLDFLDKISEFDIGQSVVIDLESKRIVNEDLSGTDLLIKRASRYFDGNKILVKTSKINQDIRIDMPTIGLRTIELLKKNNFKAIITRENSLIVLDKEKFKERSKDYKISLILL